MDQGTLNNDASSESSRFSATKFSALSILKLQPRVHPAAVDAPVFTLCFALLASFILLSGFFIVSAATLLKATGAFMLVLSLPVFIFEHLFKRKDLFVSFSRLKEIRDEVRSIRDELGRYLNDLDRRTSRYFHCVTNSKVTTYFMLRQLENSLTHQLERINTHLSKYTMRNLLSLQDLFRGTLEYRDGFEFNSGRILHIPMDRVAVRIEELIRELEKGIKDLEEEISVYREQLHGTSAEQQDDKQLPLNLGKESSSKG